MELQIANSHINCNYCASTSVGLVRTHATLSHDLHSLKGSTKPIHQNATLSQQLHASVAISATPRGNANITLLGKSSSCGLHNPARYHIRKTAHITLSNTAIKVFPRLLDYHHSSALVAEVLLQDTSVN